MARVSIRERDKLYWNFDDIMETEDKLGAKSTFFFLQESIPFELLNISNWKLSLGRYDIYNDKVANVIKTLDDQGWEIGLHGSYLSFNSLKLLKNERKQLEEVLGHEIIGIRQHYLNLNDKTWEYQQQAGFKYDSTWGFTDRIGYKNNRVKPFKPIDGAFIEFPLAIMDSCYMEDNNKEQNLEKVIAQTRESGGILVLNWHSNSWNAGEYPGYKQNYIKIIRDLQKEGAIFKTLSEFYQDTIQKP